jgi:hypothetical protein
MVRFHCPHFLRKKRLWTGRPPTKQCGVICSRCRHRSRKSGHIFLDPS